MTTIAGLFIYPIKSCAGIALSEAFVTPNGLAGDREFMVVDEQGKFLTQRQYPQMATLMVERQAEHLRLSCTGMEPFTLPLTTTGMERAVTVWRDQVIALDQGQAVAEWLQQALNLPHPIFLVRQTADYPRYIDHDYRPTPDATVSFADGFPLLVTNSASLADLNQRIITNGHSPVPMSRFRPNLVLETDIPFGEDQWQSLRTKSMTLDLVKPCSRCVVTTTDQATGDRPPGKGLQEPLATLQTFRMVPGQGIMFGQNAVPRSLGKLRVGEPVSEDIGSG